MGSRFAAIFHSTVRRESGHILLPLFRGGYLLLAIAVVFSVLHFTPDTLQAARIAYWVEFQLAGLLAIGLAHYLGSQSVGDSQTGVLELIALSGTTESGWLVFRVAHLWFAFASVWIIRLPVLSLMGTFGGVSVPAWWYKELLLLLFFVIASTFSLVGSHTAPSRQKAWGQLIGPIFFIEFASAIPTILLAQLSPLLGGRVPGALGTAAEFVSTFGLLRSWRAVYSTGATPSELWPTLIGYGVICSLMLLRFSRLLFVRIERREGPNELLRSIKSIRGSGPSRPSQRCWDDALAWQSFAYHGAGWRGIVLKVLLHVCIGAVLYSLYRANYREAAGILACVFSCAILLHCTNKPSECIGSEVREKTLSGLALTPYDIEEFYHHWRRGSWVLATPDIVVYFVTVVVATLINPVAGASLLTIGLSILGLGPLLFLSSMVPWSFLGIVTGFGVILAGVFIAAVGITIGATISAIAATVVTLPLMVVYNYFIRVSVVPYWLTKKVTSETVS